MKFLICIALALTMSWPAVADDLRVNQLENTVQRLQRELDAQSRRIDQLERAARNAVVSGPAALPAAPHHDSPAWLVAANWDRVRRGMKDLDVIALLGQPTSARTDSDGKTHTFFYALELGPAALLAGNVRLSDSGVIEINTPTLR